MSTMSLDFVPTFCYTGLIVVSTKETTTWQQGRESLPTMP